MRTLIGLLIVSVAVLSGMAIQQNCFGLGFDYNQFLYGFARTAVPMTIGVVIYRLYSTKRLPRLAFHPLVLAFLFVGVLAVPKMHDQAEIFYSLIATLIAFPAVVIFGINAKQSGWLLKVCRVGGDLSYPLYMLHGPIQQAARGASKLFSPDDLSWRFFIPVLAVCLVGALAALKLYDEPVRRFLTNAVREHAIRKAREELP